MNTKKLAKILVMCGYATEWNSCDLPGRNSYFVRHGVKAWQRVNPLADTLEGRKQADALEDWFEKEYGYLWRMESICHNQDEPDNKHQWRLDRIKWCVDEVVL